MTKTIKELHEEFTAWTESLGTLQEQWVKLEKELTEARESSCEHQQNDIWKPKEDDEVFYADVKNSVARLSGMSWDIPWQVTMYEKGLLYPTRELAQHDVNRRKAMSKRWLPQKGEACWAWGLLDNEAGGFTWSGGEDEIYFYITGNCHATEEEAEAWGERYAESFSVLWEGK